MVVKRTEEWDFRDFELHLSCKTKAWETIKHLGVGERNRVWDWLENAFGNKPVEHDFLVHFFGEERELIAHILGFEDWESYYKVSEDKAWKERHEYLWMF